MKTHFAIILLISLVAGQARAENGITITNTKTGEVMTITKDPFGFDVVVTQDYGGVLGLETAHLSQTYFDETFKQKPYQGEKPTYVMTNDLILGGDVLGPLALLLVPPAAVLDTVILPVTATKGIMRQSRLRKSVRATFLQGRSIELDNRKFRELKRAISHASMRSTYLNEAEGESSPPNPYVGATVECGLSLDDKVTETISFKLTGERTTKTFVEGLAAGLYINETKGSYDPKNGRYLLGLAKGWITSYGILNFDLKTGRASRSFLSVRSKHPNDVWTTVNCAILGIN